MHTLLVKVRIEVNSFLFHVKSKHIVCKYHIRSPEVKLVFTCELICIAYLNDITLKVPIVLCLFL